MRALIRGKIEDLAGSYLSLDFEKEEVKLMK